MTTLRRELRSKFEAVLVRFNDRFSQAEIKSTADLLADAALELRAFSYKPPTIEAAIFAGMPVTEEVMDTTQQERLACDAFERAFGIDRPWNWYPPKEEKLWADFRAKLLQLWQADNDCFTGYATWANNKYSRGAKNASQLRRDPAAFWDAWAAYKASEMYHKTDEQRPAYVPIPERIKTPKPAYVPAPNLKRNQS